MPAKTKSRNSKVRDLNPRKDAKGGRHGHHGHHGLHAGHHHGDSTLSTGNPPRGPAPQ